MDSRGKRLIMFKAKIARRFSFNGTGLRPLGPAFMADHLDGAGGDQNMSPMISNSGNMMMSAMFTPLDGMLGSQALGPPEAFYPFTSVNIDGTVAQESTSSFDEEDLDDEDLWNIGDFLNFGDDSSDEEDNDGTHTEQDDCASPEKSEPPSSTPARPSTADESRAHPLLDHLDRGVVGAFRRNQTRHQLLSRNTASHESLAFSGPYRQGTIRGIKGGRLAAANVPITPMRKQKTPKAPLLVGPSSPGSPLAAAAGKRKFSGDQRGHKRNKSAA